MSEGERMMLVYEHKANGRNFVPGGVSIMSEEDIVMVISANPDVIMLTKAIEAGQLHIDLYKADLWTDTEKVEALQKAKNARCGNDYKEVPWRVFLGHEWEGHTFEELVILTPDPSQAAANAAKVEEEESK